MHLLYFAWLRAKIGTAEEELPLPSQVHDIKSLLEWLKTRGPGYADALKDLGTVRVAVNQDYVGPEHTITDGDEVAIFPPVTGG
jgi:molybdopterin synthase sulfur carrier subunit